MAENREERAAKLQPSHERIERLHGAYVTFIAAGILALISGDGHIKSEGLTICLWAVSLPPLVTYLLIDYIVRERQKRPASAARGMMLFFGYGLSTAGTVGLLWSFSRIAAVVYAVAVPFCCLVGLRVAFFRDRESPYDV